MITFDKIVLTTLSISVSYHKQYCHYQFKVLGGYFLGLSRAIVWNFRGLIQHTPILVDHILMHWLSILVTSLEGMMPPLHRQQVSLFRWAGAFHIRHVDYFVFISDTGVTYPFHSPHFVWTCLPACLPAMTQFCDWLHSPWGSLSTSINRYTHHSLCPMYMFLPRSVTHHITCGLHPSSVDAPVDIHGRNHNLPFSTPGKLYW